MNTRTTSEQSSLCSVFLCRKTSARFLAPPLSQKVTLGSPVRLQAHSRRLSVAANLLRVFALRRKNFPFGTSYACSDFFYFIKKSVTRCTAPPLSQKVTLGSPAGLQAHSRRLSVAVNLLRVFALRHKGFPFRTSFACSDFYCKRSKLLLSVFSLIGIWFP